MKVVFIGHSGYNYPHVRVRCYNFCEAIKKLGMDAEVLSFKDQLAPQRYTEEIMYDLKDISKLYLTLKAIRKLWNKKDHIFYIQKILFHASAPLLLSKLGRNRYIFDCDDWDAKYCSLYKNKFLNKFFFGHSTNTDKFGNIIESDYEIILKDIASKAVACVVSSHALKESLSKFSEKVYYVPTGVDENKFRKKETKKNTKVRFCWLGIVWGDVIFDNIVFLLHCFSQVKRSNKDIELKIVGSGQYMHRVKELINLIYKNDDIEVTEWINPAKIPDFLSSVDVGLLPLIQQENIWINSKSPTKLFEYMAMEIPTVSSRVGEIKHVIEDGVDGFLASDKEEFISKMENLAGNQSLRKEMGVKAREKIEQKYCLTVLGKEIFNILKELKKIKL
ncbi:MAG: hypothetical protein A2149_07305 [Candidatus Schekmanbacteria bacterium RBG_16_38_11]|uniref:Glycosyl transferase family 1 domain-containing protein n=2 Tax=Candidatus Schekmaniibacteriota TaxID=1817811 RepID=A0A1F7RLX9_9BACT|nr:MAG: hypothetical protein A2042_04220 [Candidatus Schekmanbacteria bacterium GWA2_38_11]OGL46065.1 MAG: hypothetical protein A2149_07305 [Candidatus Schekmanbacteria bacterium RBG_16_38_11]